MTTAAGEGGGGGGGGGGGRGIAKDNNLSSKKMQKMQMSYPGNPATSRVNLDNSARSPGKGDLQ